MLPCNSPSQIHCVKAKKSSSATCEIVTASNLPTGKRPPAPLKRPYYLLKLYTLPHTPFFPHTVSPAHHLRYHPPISSSHSPSINANYSLTIPKQLYVKIFNLPCFPPAVSLSGLPPLSFGTIPITSSFMPTHSI